MQRWTQNRQLQLRKETAKSCTTALHNRGLELGQLPETDNKKLEGYNQSDRVSIQRVALVSAPRVMKRER